MLNLVFFCLGTADPENNSERREGLVIETPRRFLFLLGLRRKNRSLTRDATFEGCGVRAAEEV